MTMRAGVLLAILTAAALTAPLLAPYDPGRSYRAFLAAPPMVPHLMDEGWPSAPFVRPIVLVDPIAQQYETNAAERLPLPWSNEADPARPVFLLGADTAGRDVLSRLLSGARVSVGLALVSTAVTILLGALAGAWAGYRGGWLDDLLMRTADFVLVLPAIYVVLVLRAALPLVLDAATVFVLMTAIFSLASWPIVARGVRSIVALEREREFVMAARSLGARPARILVRHLLPSCAGYLVTQATLLLPAFILAEATLSFVGLGFPDTVATWGTMLTEAANVSTITRFPWMLAPAAAIFLVTFAANAAAGDGGRLAAIRRPSGVPLWR